MQAEMNTNRNEQRTKNRNEQKTGRNPNQENSIAHGTCTGWASPGADQPSKLLKVVYAS